MSRAASLTTGSFLTHTSGATHTKNTTHTSGGSIDDYGYDGLPGNPMQAAGLFEARMAGLVGVTLPVLGQGIDLGAGRAWGDPAAPSITKLPLQEDWRGLLRQGAKPRWGALLLDVITGTRFECTALTEGDPAGLQIRAGNALQQLVTMKRPARAYFEAQLPLIDAKAAQRDKRYTEVLTQVGPPMAYYAAIVGLQSERHRRTFELIGLALDLAYLVVMRFKMALACPRPHEYSVVIQPMIEVPQHGTMPAGHATEGHVIAALLGALVPGAGGTAGATLLRRAAHRIADNRIVAGLHFPIDNAAGRLLGDALGQYFLALCGAPHVLRHCTFDGTALQANGLTPADGRTEPDQPLYGGPGCTADPWSGASVDKLPMLEALWKLAQAEWA